MANKSSKRSVGVTVQIPAELHADFRDIVKSKGQNLRFVIKQLIVNYIQQEHK